MNGLLGLLCRRLLYFFFGFGLPFFCSPDDFARAGRRTRTWLVSWQPWIVGGVFFWRKLQQQRSELGQVLCAEILRCQHVVAAIISTPIEGLWKTRLSAGNGCLDEIILCLTSFSDRSDPLRFRLHQLWLRQQQVHAKWSTVCGLTSALVTRWCHGFYIWCWQIPNLEWRVWIFALWGIPRNLRLQLAAFLSLWDRYCWRWDWMISIQWLIRWSCESIKICSFRGFLKFFNHEAFLRNAELRRLAEDSKIIDALQGLGAPILIAGQDFGKPMV